MMMSAQRGWLLCSGPSMGSAGPLLHLASLPSTPVGLEPSAAGAREASKSLSNIHQSSRLPAQRVTALGGSQAKPGRQQLPLACPQATWSDKELTSHVDNGPLGMVDVGARPVGCGSKGIKPRSQGRPRELQRASCMAGQAGIRPRASSPAHPAMSTSGPWGLIHPSEGQEAACVQAAGASMLLMRRGRSWELSCAHFLKLLPLQSEHTCKCLELGREQGACPPSCNQMSGAQWAPGGPSGSGSCKGHHRVTRGPCTTNAQPPYSSPSLRTRDNRKSSHLPYLPLQVGGSWPLSPYTGQEKTWGQLLWTLPCVPPLYFTCSPPTVPAASPHIEEHSSFSPQQLKLFGADCGCTE